VWAQIKALFEAETIGTSESIVDKKHLAAAALLIDVACADDSFDSEELAVLEAHLIKQFQLSDDIAKELCDYAQQKHKDSTSLYEFTQLINKHFTASDKYDLVVGMWDVAYADGNIDRYEEHLIRQASDLIYVCHSDFIKAKHTARASYQGQSQK
jgi:uncharacterized tellurite resistance protein B-like protein